MYYIHHLGFDFDDDDILADILASSDEDDRKFRPKRKRKETGVVPSEKNETKEIKEDDKTESLLSRMSPKLRRVRKNVALTCI